MSCCQAGGSLQTQCLRIRIRDPVPFWPLDPGWVKVQDPDPGWTTRIIFPRELKKHFFGIKILEFFDADPWCKKIWIRDGKNSDPYKHQHPGNATLYRPVLLVVVLQLGILPVIDERAFHAPPVVLLYDKAALLSGARPLLPLLTAHRTPSTTTSPTPSQALKYSTWQRWGDVIFWCGTGSVLLTDGSGSVTFWCGSGSGDP